MLVLAIVISYFLGAIPIGYILSRVLKGIDIRKYGSGNIGATNVFRVVSPLAGLVVLLLDMLKGLIPVVVLGDVLLQWMPAYDHVFIRILLGIAAVCGHNWTIFLQFKGGKGIATTAGVLLGLSIKVHSLGIIVLLCLLVWIAVVFITRYVSLGSIAAACVFPILMIVFGQPVKLVLFAVALGLFAVYRHKSNIYKLLRGEEHKISLKKG
ncbi:MAG: glycerol-3-phosphate 1-O-acyltransferase PlsY [Candidatus Omnitrophota bacterium]